MSFSWNLLLDLADMLQYPFMVHAFEVGTLIAILAGIVGYLVVLRHSAFAAHALAHTGFAGGAGAVLIGVNPILGLLASTTASGSAIAVLGERAAHRDVEIGSVLAFMLGLGLLFTILYRGFSHETYSFLFGDILGISSGAVTITLETTGALLIALALVYRPLLFASLDEDVAEAKGMPLLFLGWIFMLFVAVVTSIAVQVVGVLLVFALMVTPAAIGMRLSSRPLFAVVIAALVALSATWAGLFIGYYSDYPVSFFITTLIFGAYVLVRFLHWLTSKLVLRTILARRPTPTNGSGGPV